TDAMEQMEWLVRKGEQAGFELMRDPFAVDGYAVTVVDERQEHGQRRNGNSIDKLTHAAVRYDGVLTVTDTIKFQDALRNGIGPAKAYGFGLMSVTPA
ncbi:MAG: type I-E CRISPR-associated protein Cas6/Cse3/CasE, partial [Roseiflexaceae bacterium]